MKPTVIVYGPKGCGKTRNRDRFLKAWGLRASVELDEQRRGFPVPAYETLVLTFKDGPAAGKLAAKIGARVISFAHAILELEQ
ncbi:hypothetical protein D3C77_49050 [compost metagenome]